MDANGADGKRHQVFKFSRDGKVLMTLGHARASGSGPGLFDQTTDVVVGPNDDILVTGSHCDGKNNSVAASPTRSQGRRPARARYARTPAADARASLA